MEKKLPASLARKPPAFVPTNPRPTLALLSAALSATVSDFSKTPTTRAAAASSKGSPASAAIRLNTSSWVARAAGILDHLLASAKAAPTGPVVLPAASQYHWLSMSSKTVPQLVNFRCKSSWTAVSMARASETVWAASA
ncbi:MAG: hypothetical protein JO063_12710 [Pseudonocardiales bacterium]|nr:hypothetical protein [Pseudonocardiales bacterium]MBW0010952.1 hypothetical protein [Pseudonocardiales bacterium]